MEKLESQEEQVRATIVQFKPLDWAGTGEGRITDAAMCCAFSLSDLSSSGWMLWVRSKYKLSWD